MSDLGNANWSETDASNNASPPNGWPEGMNPSDVNNSARANMGALKRWWNRGNAIKTTGGTSTAYTLTYDVAAASYYDGEEFSFVVDQTCGDDPTLNISGLGDKNLRKFTAGAWANLAAGDVVADQVIRVRRNAGDDKFDIIGFAFSVDAFVQLDADNAFTGDNTFTGLSILSKPVIPSGASFLPQGQLTLATGVPVMVSAQTGKTVIYYTPHQGNLIPIYDGTYMVPTVFAELSNDTTQSSTGKAGPAAVTTNSNYDLFVWDDAGTKRLTRGPLWDSSTARGTGAGTTEVQRIDGVWTNKVDISNGPAANRGTYVGTVRSDGSSQINWQPGGTASGGTAAVLGVWNAYNRVSVEGIVKDSTTNWSYSTQAFRPANNSTAMRVSFVIGLQEDAFYASYVSSSDFTGGVTSAFAGVGYDSTSSPSGRFPQSTAGNVSGNALAFNAQGDYTTQPLGFHFMQALEWGGSNWYGSGGLLYRGRF